MIQDKIYNYFERNENLKVLFIFDQMDAIASELRSLPWRKGFSYIEFDGSWFKTKYALENEWQDNKVILVFKSISPLASSAEAINFPLLDVLCANMEYKNDDFAAFMQQHNIPEKFNNFVRKHIDELQLEKFNKVLEPYYNADNFSIDLAYRGLISGYLGEKQLLDWDNIIIKLFTLSLVNEKKKCNNFFLSIDKKNDISTALQNAFISYFGVKYNLNVGEKLKEPAESFMYNAITQLLTDNEGDNYKKYKINDSIKLDRINMLFEKAKHLSKTKSEQFFEALNTLSKGIKVKEIIKTYGIDANYFFVPAELCWEIINKVFSKQIVAKPEKAGDKFRELLIKQENNEDIYNVLNYGLNVAGYYDKANSISSLKLNTPNDYVRKYIAEFYILDTFYRKSIEEYHKISDTIPIMPHIEKIKKQLDTDYAKLCNIINIEWLTCLQEKGGGLNALDIISKQQDFYDSVKTIQTKLVVIISDALRYEVAVELMQYLAKERNVATLDAAIATLPTETKFCKPALLPHHRIWLYENGVEMDMAVDDKILNTINKRSEHIALYRQNAICVDYVNVANDTIDSNRELFKRPLVYIFHNTIDERGHSNNPMEVVEACSKAVKELAELIRRLHATYNVANVVLTSDHGFLYNDINFEEKDKQTVAEDTLEKKSRYYLTKSAETIQGIIKFPLQEVSGMNNDIYVAVPEGTNRLAAQGGGYIFTHGGASLQELIIPVIHSKIKKVNNKQKVGVVLVTRNLSMVSSRLKFKIMQSESVDMDTLERTVTCAVYDNDVAVTAEKIIHLKSTDAENFNNRIYDVDLTINKSTGANIMQLHISDIDDPLNPLIKETVINNTLIGQDF
jgi:hypothetical protein